LDSFRSLSEVIKKGDCWSIGLAQPLECPKGDPVRRRRVPRDHDTEPAEIRGLVHCRMTIDQLDIEATGYGFNYFGLPDPWRPH
jgi:hypothetical protein